MALRSTEGLELTVDTPLVPGSTPYKGGELRNGNSERVKINSMEHNLKSTLSQHFKDQGAAGKLESELIRRLGPERCWRVEWLDGCKDANDMLISALKHIQGRERKMSYLP
jgi:hypothetical protein